MRSSAYTERRPPAAGAVGGVVEGGCAGGVAGGCAGGVAGGVAGAGGVVAAGGDDGGGATGGASAEGITMFLFFAKILKSFPANDLSAGVFCSIEDKCSFFLFTCTGGFHRRSFFLAAAGIAAPVPAVAETAGLVEADDALAGAAEAARTGIVGREETGTTGEGRDTGGGVAEGAVEIITGAAVGDAGDGAGVTVGAGATTGAMVAGAGDAGTAGNTGTAGAGGVGAGEAASPRTISSSSSTILNPLSMGTVGFSLGEASEVRPNGSGPRDQPSSIGSSSAGSVGCSGTICHVLYT